LKGFGYAEFEDLDSLLSALSLNEEVKKLKSEGVWGELTNLVFIPMAYQVSDEILHWFTHLLPPFCGFAF
jgi:hypothetical protein